MNKKFKIVSSLALAGLLSINVFSPKALAATIDDKIETNPVGAYRNLVEGKAVVPYVLVGNEDAVTVKEIVNSKEFSNVTKFNGTSIPDENTLVCTGDTFVADGQEYTVIVYGDVNKDGKINSKDAVLAEKYSAELETLDAVQLEAADVINDGTINSKDAKRIRQYSAELVTPVIDKVPDAEKQEEEKSNYTVSVNDNGKISNQNADTTILKLKVATTLKEDKTFTVTVVGADGKEVKISEGKVLDKDGNVVKEGALTIPAHTDYVEVALDLSSIPDGKIAGTVEVKDDKTKTKFTTEKSTVAPVATNVVTNRINTKSASLSLESCGKNEIAKVYYEVVEHDSSEPAEIKNEVKVANGAIKDVTVATDLTTDTAYDVWYVLEDSFGSKSEAKKAIITSDSAKVSQEQKIKEVTAPDLTKTDVANFTWKAKAGKTYKTTLYKDGKAVAIKDGEVSGENGTVNYSTEMEEEGTYKVEVYVEGTDMSKASEPTASKEVKVEKLPAVTDLAFVNEDNKVILSWKNANKEEDFKEYKIDLVTIDKDGKESEPSSVDTSRLKTSENKIDITSYIANNTIYKAKVTIIAKDDQMAKINSKETVSEQFYKVGVPTIDGAETSENSVTLKSNGISINEKKATYKVKVFDVNEKATPEEAYYTLKTTKSVEIKDGKMVIDGLDDDTLYAFKLIATIDGTEVESYYTYPVSTLPELTNLTVVKDEKEAKAEGKVYSVDEDTIVLAGKTIELYNYNGSSKLANSMKLIKALKVGDVVSVKDNKVSLKLDGGASANVAERDFTGVDLAKASVTVESNDFSKTLEINEVKELTLKGTGSIFNLDSVTAKKIVLTNGVEVTASKEQVYTVNAGSKVTMNQIKMTTAKDTVVTADGSTLGVAANTVSNDLVFENKKGQPVTIEFNGEQDNTSTQAGTITIKENATVTIVSNNVHVNADLNVEVNNGDIDVTEPSLTGDKNITVAKDAKTTITAVAKTKAPVAFTNKELKDYTDEELKKDYGENASKVKEYLASFGINGKGAKLTVAKDSTEVTITFEKALESATIQNIK